MRKTEDSDQALGSIEESDEDQSEDEEDQDEIGSLPEKEVQSSIPIIRKPKTSISAEAFGKFNPQTLFYQPIVLYKEEMIRDK